MNQPKVSIVIPTFNRKKDLIDVINAVKKWNYTNYEFIIVDDASTDWTKEELNRLFPEIKIIVNTKNMWASYSRNIWMKNISEDVEYILLLDSDVIIDPDAISWLVDVLASNPEYGAATGKIYFDEDHQLIQRAGTSVGLYTGMNYGRWGKDVWQYEKIEEIQWAGAIMMIKTEIIEKVWFYDEVYFIYYEDADYSLRIWKAGYKIVYVPNSVFYHRYPILDQKSNDARFLSHLYLSSRNKIIFMKKHAKSFLVFLLYFPIYPAFYTYKCIKYRDFKAFKNFWRGIFDGFAYVFTKKIPQR